MYQKIDFKGDYQPALDKFTPFYAKLKLIFSNKSTRMRFLLINFVSHFLVPLCLSLGLLFITTTSESLLVITLLINQLLLTRLLLFCLVLLRNTEGLVFKGLFAFFTLLALTLNVALLLQTRADFRHLMLLLVIDLLIEHKKPQKLRAFLYNLLK